MKEYVFSKTSNLIEEIYSMLQIHTMQYIAQCGVSFFRALDFLPQGFAHSTCNICPSSAVVRIKNVPASAKMYKLLWAVSRWISQSLLIRCKQCNVCVLDAVHRFGALVREIPANYQRTNHEARDPGVIPRNIQEWIQNVMQLLEMQNITYRPLHLLCSRLFMIYLTTLEG